MNYIFRFSVRYVLILSILLVTSISTAIAQVNVLVNIDSLNLMVGEQTRIHLKVEANANQKVVLPVFSDTLVKGVIIVEQSKPETQKIEGSNRIAITQDYLVTAFDSALYYIPPFKVKVDNQLFQSKSLALKVNTIPIPMDSVNVNHFFGPRDVQHVDYTWAELKGLILGGILIIVMTLLSIILYRKYKDNKPIVRIVKVEPKLPPHLMAIKKIEEIKSSRLSESGNVKAYYTQLTDVLRSYLNERFHFNATEMTSSEILEKLNELDAQNALDEFKSLLQTADMVKFAKYITQLNENDKNLMNAIEFINKTKQEDNVIEQQPENKVEVVAGRTKKQQMVLLAVIIVTSVVGLVSLGWTLWIVKVLFFE